jgi:hypothetical protein
MLASQVQSVNASPAQLIARARVDYDTFVAILIPEVLEKPITDYQRRVFWRMVSDDIPRYACALPRGHIKTVLLKMAILYRLTYKRNLFPLFLAGTVNLAESGVSDIINILKSENYTRVYGEVTFTRQRSNTADYEFDMNEHLLDMQTGNPLVRRKQCMLRGRSSGQSVRGSSRNFRRPDFIGMDDIDQDSDIKSELGYTDLKSWVYGPVMKIGYKDTSIVHIGNFIAQKCVIGDHVLDPGWTSDHYSVLLPNGEPLWPGYWTREELVKDFKDYERQGMANTWFAEMLNNPMENANGMLAYNDIRFLPELHPEAYGTQYRSPFIVVDPAISNSKRANSTAIAVHAYNIERDVWQLAEVYTEKGMDSIKLFKKLVELSEKWFISNWFIEAVAYQASLLPLYRAFLANAGLDGIKLFATPGSYKQKSARIIPWLNLVKAGGYALTQGQLEITRNMLAYNPSDEDNIDDDLDVAAYSIPCQATYGLQIESATAYIAQAAAPEYVDGDQLLVR